MHVCYSFGKMAAHGGKSIDPRLTVNDEDTLNRMLAAREGEIGAPCERDTKHRGGKGHEYPGPGFEPVKSSVSERISMQSMNITHYIYRVV